jgi:hypothetical protein
MLESQRHDPESREAVVRDSSTVRGVTPPCSPRDSEAACFQYSDWLDRVVKEDQKLDLRGSNVEVASDVLPLWRSLYQINGAPESGGFSLDCLDEGADVQWCQIIPDSEEHIVSSLIWLRGCGVLSKDPYEVMQWKASIQNVFPMATLACSVISSGSHESGVLLAPTKKCIWRLCLLVLRSLYIYASSPNAQPPFENTNVKDMLRNWDEMIKCGINVTMPRGNRFTMGREYLRAFKTEYLASQVSISAQVDGKIVKANIVSDMYFAEEGSASAKFSFHCLV